MSQGPNYPMDGTSSGSRFRGTKTDRREERKNLDTVEVLDEFGIDVNPITSFLTGQVDVLRRTVVDTSSYDTQEIYDIEGPVGKLRVRKVEEEGIQYVVETPLGEYEIEN